MCTTLGRHLLDTWSPPLVSEGISLFSLFSHFGNKTFLLFSRLLITVFHLLYICICHLTYFAVINKEEFSGCQIICFCLFIPSLKVVILEGSTWFSHYLDRLGERFRLILDLFLLVYSQPCLQRPPLGHKKSGRCSKVTA